MSEQEATAAGEAGTAPGGSGPPPATSSAGVVLRWLAAGACVGAAIIHFAYAPAHMDEDAAHGVFFLAAGWAQLGAAVALVRGRDTRWPLWAAAAVNAAVAAVWLVSRTVGVPGSDAEPVGFPDALATGLEVVAVTAALAALRPALAGRRVGRLDPVVGVVAALVLVGLVSASVTPSIAGEHGHDGDTAAGAHDDGHGHGATAALASASADERCDLGFNTPAFNEVSQPGVPHAHDDGQQVDFTLEEWAEVFVDPERGIPAAAVVAYIEDRPVLRDGILTGSLTHTLDPDPWNPITDSDECAALADELARAKAVAAAHPTAADAEAAGYRKVTTYYPGIAAHYMNFDLLRDGFVLEQPEMLLYDGDGPEANVVGLSYYILKEGDDEPTEGFTGDNDHYHRHVGLCIRDGVVAAGSNTSDDECSSLGGRKADGTAGWMSHVWITPGCESDWGVFSGANPALTVRPLGDTTPQPPGCGTGLTMDDDLAFDDGGGGPRL
ncbi:MAG TPA: hypothetical protein VFP06_21195 [Acidimicrobiales bacterium]|nr:hypothetical protein [Acidimicrobiales bacterium]